MFRNASVDFKVLGKPNPSPVCLPYLHEGCLRVYGWQPNQLPGLPNGSS